MKTKNELMSEYIADFQGLYCPFGSLDIRRAIELAIESKLVEYGHEAPEKVMEIAEDFVDGTGIELKNVDICYCVLDSIFQKARTEIEEKIDVDVENDYTFCTCGDYMCSSFDYSCEDVEKLRDKIKKAGLSRENFTDVTKYFFSECEIC